VNVELAAMSWCVLRLWDTEVLAGPDLAAQRIKTALARAREGPLGERA
jgi:very-short-patch-repair endonuclease